MHAAVLESLVRNGEAFVNDWDDAVGGGHWRFGLSPNYSREDLVELIEKSYSSNESFKEYFSIALLAPGSIKSSDTSIDEPFTIFSFEDRRGGLAVGSPSKSLVRIKDKTLASDFDIGLLERYKGFGANFFSLDRYWLSADCCNNVSKNNESIKGSVIEGARRWTIESLQSGTNKSVIAVSNCGEVLTYENNEHGVRLKSTFFILRE